MAKLVYTQEEKDFRASIKTDEVGAVSIKRVNPPKDKETGAILKDDNGDDIESFQVEIAEKLVKTNGGGFNVLAHANPLNPVFRTSSGLRNAWLTVSKEFAQAVFGCDINAVSALPIHTSENQARVYIGKMNPGFHLDGTEMRYKVQLVAKFASTFKENSYDLIHLLGDKGQNATAKKAGAQGRFIMGLNKETGEIEHIIEKGMVNVATVNEDGTTTNAKNSQGKPWDHILIDEYVDNTQTSGVPHELNTSTGKIEVSSSGIPTLG